MFDAQAYWKTTEPPTFKDPKGRVHVGRLIGADTFMRLQATTRTKKPDGTPDLQALNQSMRRIVEAMFPHPWWKVWSHSVQWYVWRLPQLARMRAIWDFMQSQARANGTELGPLPGITPETSGATDGTPVPQTPGS